MKHQNDPVIGVDFGTTNSSAAIFLDGKVRFFNVDPESSSPKTLKSSIFLHSNGNITVGEKAINEYLEKFKNFEIKTMDVSTDRKEVVHIWEGHFYYDFVREEVEVNLPSRLILSPKRAMPSSIFNTVEIYREEDEKTLSYSIQELGAMILKKIKTQAEKELGQSIKSINLGRPIHFGDQGGDDLAISRITEAAKLAGFKNISFTYEPLGAAFNYALTNNSEKLGIVFDFGGGTFDTSVVEFKSNGEMNVLSNEGVYVGGNKLNENLIYEKFLKYYGKDLKFGNLSLPIPDWILKSVSRWEMAPILRKKDNLSMIERIRSQVDEPHLIDNLLHMIKYNIGLSLFLLAEESKVDLSDLKDNEMMKISWEENNVKINETLSQNEFKTIIWNDISRIVQV